MDLPIKSPLDEILSQLALMRPFPRKVLFWGEEAGRISSYVAGWMADKGIDVILLDGANRFDPYMASSLARRALIPPETLLKRIRIARAFTCYQMATLMGERLVSLLRQEGVTTPWQKPWVIVLGPITTFLDEDVPEREVRPLFERSLKKVEEMAMGEIPFFLFQPSIFSKNNLPLTRSTALSPAFEGGGGKRRSGSTLSLRPELRPRAKPRHLCRGVEGLTKGRMGGLMDSKRAYLTKRLFQFSNLVWRISLDNQELKMILEKGLTKIADRRLQIAD